MLTVEDKAEIDAYITHRILMFYESMRDSGELLPRYNAPMVIATTKEYKRPEWDWSLPNESGAIQID